MEGGEVHRLVLGAGLDGLGVTLDGQLIAAAFEILVAPVLGGYCLLQRICWLLFHNVLDCYLFNFLLNARSWLLLWRRLDRRCLLVCSLLGFLLALLVAGAGTEDDVGESGGHGDADGE